MMRPYVKQILMLTLKLLQTDNEENVLVCLRIIIDIHKQYRPPFHPEVILRFYCLINFCSSTFHTFSDTNLFSLR